MKTTLLKILVLSLAFTGMTWAADEDEDPGRGVARISLINGDVSVRRGDSGDLVAAAVNAPLVVQDQVITGTASRAEVQFDWANMVRLSSNAEIRLADLENRRYLIQVAQGNVTYRVSRDSDADVEISTPSVSVRPMRKGSYRITVREDGESEVTVRSGEAEIFTPRGTERLRSGRTMLARGSASDPEYRVVSAIDRDNWDQWNEERDRRFENTQAYRYVDRSVYGAEDLDGYGSWDYVTPYGWVWAPRVAVGWAPYSYGRWAWMDWYGWSWVSYDPWGWAPFHYGRWFYHAPRGWCWYPGQLHYRHHWSPALVAFFGYGGWGGFQAGYGMGHVGWVPLAPHEAFHPWYGRGYYRGYRNNTYIDNSVTIVNNTNIVNVYKNARITNAVTAVDASQFGRGGNMVRVSGNDMRRVDLVRGQLPMVPGRESLNISNRQIVTTPQRRAPGNERFFSRTQPAQVERVPFEQQQRGIEQAARRTFGEPARVRRVEPVAAPQAGDVRATPRAEVPRTGEGSAVRPAPETGGGANGGWRRTGEAPQRGVDDQGRTQQWRRFGGPASRPAVREDRAEPRTPANQAAPGAQEPTIRRAPTPETRQPVDNNQWRRFERTSPRAEQAAPARPVEEMRREAPVYRSAPAETPRREAPVYRSEPTESPRREAPVYRSAPRSNDEPRYSQPQIRISPPIVRERQAPAPRMESPRMESPRPAPQVREMPRSSGGGGGGASRSGGEARSSGGGGGRVRR